MNATTIIDINTGTVATPLTMVSFSLRVYCKALQSKILVYNL